MNCSDEMATEARELRIEAQEDVDRNVPRILTDLMNDLRAGRRGDPALGASWYVPEITKAAHEILALAMRLDQARAREDVEVAVAADKAIDWEVDLDAVGRAEVTA